jgi:hypothetical protein
MPVKQEPPLSAQTKAALAATYMRSMDGLWHESGEAVNSNLISPAASIAVYDPCEKWYNNPKFGSEY